jgi:Tfp pilus assembly protein PilF
MFNRSTKVAVLLACAFLLSPADSAWARGGGGGGGHGGGGGGGHGGGGAGFAGGGHFGGAGWGGRGYGFGGYRGGGWGGYRGYGWGGYRGYGYGWGYPYGYGYGYGLGLGFGSGLYGGYGGYGYGGYGYGYPGYGYYGYDQYGAGYGGGYGAAYDPSPYNGSSSSSSPPAAAHAAKPMQADSSTLKAARDFADKGEAEFRAGDYDAAVYALRHAAVDDPNNAVVTLLLGQALFATGKFDEAAGATQAAMRQLTKERWGVVISHYTELYRDTKDYTQQLRALERAMKEKPDEPALRFLAGFHYAYLGFTQQAVEQLERALKLAPRDEMARQLRDDLHSKLAKPSVPPVPPAPGIPTGPAIDDE